MNKENINNPNNDDYFQEKNCPKRPKNRKELILKISKIKSNREK